ncbi:MAG: hypothetical protein EBR09_03370 [Proteobacteria bacterium]|nr:hypothetical protein [Pseudomonadota bacterium]
MLKLPKSLETDARAPLIQTSLSKNLKPLWIEGRLKVPTLELSPALEKILSLSRRAGQLRGGLENIESCLRREKDGLDALKQRKLSQDSGRMSRILLMSSDGSERFYRHCESLLEVHSDRLIGIRLNIASQNLGQKFFGKDAQVKAVLVTHKDFVARALESLADS